MDPLGRVPAIGLIVILLSRNLTSISGLLPIIWKSLKFKKNIKGEGLFNLNFLYISKGCLFSLVSNNTLGILSANYLARESFDAKNQKSYMVWGVDRDRDEILICQDNDISCILNIKR